MKDMISIEISEETLSYVVARFAEIEAVLKPLTQLLPEERKNFLLKVGDVTQVFIDKVDYFATANPKYIPSYLDLAEFKRDQEAMAKLGRMKQLSDQVATMIGDTLALTANDSFDGALTYYRAVKRASQDGVIGAKEIYDDLAERFPVKPKGRKKPAKKKVA
jgi:hypothetical protein